MRTIFKTILILALTVSSAAWANVSLKNGNYFIGFEDLSYSGGFEPKIERVYNSKSSYDGIFGFGWGSDYEVYLTVSADGSVIVHENGGGSQNRFTPPNINPKEIDNAVEMIYTAKNKSGAGLSGSAANAERERLRNDAHYRNDEWEKLFAKNLVQPRKVPDGAVFKSNRFSYQILTKINKGYTRRFDSGKVETFDEAGKLVRVADKNGNYINLGYDKVGHMVSITDNLNRKITLSYNKEGKVEKVMGENGKFVSYKYSGLELTSTIDETKAEFKFKYSSNGRHNLVEMIYPDGTKETVGYLDASKGEMVEWVKDRDGTLTEYEYGGDGAGGTHFTTEVVTKLSDGKTLSKAKYEYWEKSKPDGERYTARLLTEIDGDKTDTAYNENGLPTIITRNGEKTSFEYDAKGHVTKKITPTEVTELQYDSRSSKVSRVTKRPKYPNDSKSKKSVQWAEYQYDERGNLTYARNSDNKSVKIVYDHTGRIKALVDQDKRRLEFTYNEASRPVEIKDPAVGKIQVQYTNTGEIKKVESTGGRTVASQVTSTFQNLLDIIRPAGVSLTF